MQVIGWTDAEVEALCTAITEIIVRLRNASSRGDLEGVASGSVRNILRRQHRVLARKVGTRSNLVSLAQRLGFTINGGRGGRGLAGSGVWEYIDLPGKTSVKTRKLTALPIVSDMGGNARKARRSREPVSTVPAVPEAGMIAAGNAAHRMLTEHKRRVALGSWGEAKAFSLLTRAGFSNVRDMNAETVNHPFGDIYAERGGTRFLIGVKTRNKYQIGGALNPCYNVRKKGADVMALARRYDAQLAWVAIPVIPERAVFWSYFGTIAMIEDKGERFSIPLRPSVLSRYECLAAEETDPTIRPEWTNGGYGVSAR